MADQDSIEALVYRYAFAYDSRETAALAALYTEDGEFSWRITRGAAGGPFIGRAAIAASNAQSLAAQDDLRRHIMTNIVTTQQGDRGTARSYLTLAVVADGALRVIATGVYSDECVRVDGQWLFQSRDLVMDLAF